MPNFLDSLNPGKLISDGLISILLPLLATKVPHAPDAFNKIKAQIDAGTATKEQIQADIHAIILAAEDLTPDAVDELLNIVARIVDDSFALAEQWPIAFPPKA